MPLRKSKGKKSTVSTKRKTKTSYARPMSSLKHNYRATNVYRFVRETLPITKSFNLISAGTVYPAMGYLKFDNLQFDLCVNAKAEFGPLFARYKVDKIETILTPTFTNTSSSQSLPGLRITRINTKWFNAGFSTNTTSDDQLAELAQLQSKTVSNYASNRSLILITNNPGVQKKSVLDDTGAELITRASAPWMNITSQSDVPLRHNSTLLAERIDGLALTADWKYRVVHKLYFRCSQVG